MASDDVIEQREVEAQLERILVSPVFQPAKMLCDMLRFVVEETLAGRHSSIKGYTLATRVFGRTRDFDPSTDPIVRIHAGRLRRRLSEYYAGEGISDPIRIEVPKGANVPVFTRTTGVERGQSAGTAPSLASEVRGSRFDGPSVAVLPITGIGPSDEEGMLAEGINEELILALSRFEGLAVISRQSMLRYRDSIPTVEQVAHDLGVRYVISGSVRKIDDNLRVATQLSDCRDSSQIWAEVFNRDLSVESLFAIQDEITSKVVANVFDEYGVIPRQLIQENRGKRPHELSVYEAVLRFYQYNLTGNPEIHKEARAALEKCVEVDPEYALAWALLAEMYGDCHAQGFEGPDNPLELAHRYIHRALNYDPGCQQAQTTSSYIHFLLDEHATAIEAADRAIKLNPSSGYQVAVSAFWTGLSGELDRACEILDRVEKLIPFEPGWLRLVPLLRYLERGDHDRALREAHRFCTPYIAWDSLLRAATAALAGNSTIANIGHREFSEMFPEVAADPEPYIRGYVHADLHVATLLRGLEQAARLNGE